MLERGVSALESDMCRLIIHLVLLQLELLPEVEELK